MLHESWIPAYAGMTTFYEAVRLNPKIVVTVDMLSTGVDIPSLEFVVFLRPVKSRILWVQMLGRGTRKCDVINKEKFTIFDCFDGTLIEYFKNTTDFDVQPPDTMKLLRDKDFQELLLNYERAKRQFLVGYEIEDAVSSEVMIHVGSDYQKPEDYLDSFARFVRVNPEQIDAIRILLERPKDWKTGALKELREKLALNKFPEIELRKAHRLIYHKALADIISMVKHAARAEEPIYSAAERVDGALAKVTAGKTFTEEQPRWLGYIREHLIENLTIDLADFDDIPVFERHGGAAIANQVFDNALEALIAEINYAIAA